MAEAPGKLIDHYRLVAPIGSGGFSTVYRAIDERLDAEVAIKVLAENHALDPDVRERFVAEAQLLRRIECNAVIAVHDIGETERSQPYIVMALADRGDLATRSAAVWGRSGYQVTRHEALLIAQTLTTGLGRAHRAGLVHRDVKPANLLLAADRHAQTPTTPPSVPKTLIHRDEHVLLSDMGFGKDLLASSGLTVGGGTYGFAAPEQRAAHSTVDARADIHAASALVYWLFTQETPPDDGRLRHEKLPPGLASVLARGLDPEPAQRFDTIDEWFDHVGATLVHARPSGAASGPGAVGIADGVADGLVADGVVAAGVVAAGVVAAGFGAEAQVQNPRPLPSTRRRGRLWVVALFALLIGGAVGVGVARQLDLFPGPGPGPEITDTVDGGRRMTATRGELTLTVTGPRTVAVGDKINLVATMSGAASIRWFAPVGGIKDADALTLNAERPGVAAITAVAADPDGRTVAIEFEVTVEQAE